VESPPTMAKAPAKAPNLHAKLTASPATLPTPAPKLDEAQVQAALAGTPEWSELGDTIQRTYQFKNFVESLAFVQKVAEAAERDQHHPDILIRYNKVTLTLSTHDSGGLTAKDFAAARTYDGLVVRK
jgi:4a-hydroxytetrahydrobiopterin dehydratase